MNYCLEFSHRLAGQGEFSGGKGANLSLLTQRGFPVPSGFVVTAQGYREFARAAEAPLRRVDDFHFDDPVALREESASLREELERIPLPEVLAAEARKLLAAWPANTAFSVRSSSTFEDLATAAFAGQHDTFLNCVGEADILEKIRACYASLWQERAIAYRRRQGFDHREVAMAVVVQQMIRCDIAGVGFTINPVSGALDEMLVNANYGLGESVVSGEGEVDQFVLNKAGDMVSSSIGHKSHCIVCSETGTEERALSEEEAVRPCLDESQLKALAELMLRVEQSYQFPQDIEWGSAKGTLYLLQSRPVTTIPPRWTRDESAERFPNVITPLAWDMVEEGFHRSLNHSFRLMGYPPFGGKWFGMQGHYIYGNQNAVEIYGKRAPFAVKDLKDLEAQLPNLGEQFAWVQELPLEWSRDLDHYLLRIGRFMAEPLEDKDLGEVWRFVQEVNRLGTEYFLPNIAISLTQRTLYKVLHGMLRFATGDAEAASRMFDSLLAHCETKTGIVNKELYRLASLARNNPELSRMIEETPSRDIVSGERFSAFPEFDRRFGKFLRDHGHREIDFDPYQPTWVEAPWVVIDNLRLIVRQPEKETLEERERDLKVRMQEAEFALFSRLPVSLHFFFHELLRLARTYTSLDDVEHYQTTRLTLPLRKGLRELGHRLVRRGILEEPMDVFFARHKELDEAISSDDNALWDKLAESVRKEKAAYLTHRETPPDWVLGERPQATTRDEGSGLAGLPGSPGVAEGEVFLVLSSDDFAKFPKGAVLVARTTNPAWTPLFYSAAAVITESGGPLSHGAVTAREMQIPAVMSVHGVLSRLKNGQRVRVDGGQGRVNLI